MDQFNNLMSSYSKLEQYNSNINASFEWLQASQNSIKDELDRVKQASQKLIKDELHDTRQELFTAVENLQSKIYSTPNDNKVSLKAPDPKLTIEPIVSKQVNDLKINLFKQVNDNHLQLMKTINETQNSVKKLEEQDTKWTNEIK